MSITVQSEFDFCIREKNFAKGLELMNAEFNCNWKSLADAMNECGLWVYGDGDIDTIDWEMCYDDAVRALRVLAPVVEDGSKVVAYVHEFGYKDVFKYKNGELHEYSEDLDDDDEDDEDEGWD